MTFILKKAKRSGFWVLVLLLISAVLAIAGEDDWEGNYFRLDVMLMWAWLGFASHLTDYAHTLLEDCRVQLELRRAPELEREKHWSIPVGAGWLAFKIRGRGALFFIIPFTALGVTAGVLGLVIPSRELGSHESPGACMLATATIGVVFAFVGVGFHGACAALGLACTVARRNSHRLHLDHGDRQGGLGPVVRLADLAGLFILSGALALPLVFRIAEGGLKRWKSYGEASTGADFFAAVSAITAIVVWAMFVVGGSVTGRVEASHALARFRDAERLKLISDTKLNAEERKAKVEALDSLRVEGLDKAAWFAVLRNLIVAATAIAAFGGKELVTQLLRTH